MRIQKIATLVAGVSLSVSAQAVNVVFTGTILDSCILTISVPGALGMSADGTELSSQSVGGLRATMAVVSTGSAPTINFTAPVLGGPTGSITGATKAMAFSSLAGASQPWVSTGSSYTMGRLLDTIQIDARATNPNGFASGTYTVTTVATCQQ